MKVLKIKFGANGKKVDAFGIRFYGDIDSNAKQLGSIREIIPDPVMTPKVQNQRITIWYTFKKIRSFETISLSLIDLTDRLMGKNYMTMISSIDEIVDTTWPKYKGKPESKFPISERIHGYNAARGFSATVVKANTEAKYSMKEIEAIQELVKDFSRTVYGSSQNTLM